MLNTWLTIGYFTMVGLTIASRDRFLDDNLVVAGVAGVLLFLGLALWVFVAQRYRNQ